MVGMQWPNITTELILWKKEKSFSYCSINVYYCANGKTGNPFWPVKFGQLPYPNLIGPRGFQNLAGQLVFTYFDNGGNYFGNSWWKQAQKPETELSWSTKTNVP